MSGKAKLYLPKKTVQVGNTALDSAGIEPATPGVQLQDGHRRRLQALAAAQNGFNGGSADRRADHTTKLGQSYNTTPNVAPIPPPTQGS